jgi:CubicO group peptidase (beta-lactamase class C family)
MVRYRVPAVSVAVMDGGRVAWARAWGTADVATGAPASPGTLFQAASISKPVAALAALSLVQEGLLELDGPVDAHLTGWRIPENDFTADSAVTLRGLLTHSAGTTVWGFPGYRKDRPFAEGQVLASNAQVLEGEGNTDPVRVFRVPGTGWQYSGGGYTVMEQMVEDVTGRPFHEVARERVLVPAAMERSTFVQPLPEARWYEAARGHRGDGREVEGEWHTYPEQAAAGLWTTPTELLRLSEHLLGILDGSVEDGILSREMLEAALTPHRGGEERYRRWGLGFGLDGEGEAATFGHGGSNEGFKAQWTVYRNRGQGIAVMTNGDQGSALAREVMRAAAAVYGWPGLEPEERRRAERSAASLRELEGTYRLVDGPGLTVTVRAVEGALEVDVPDRGTSTIHPDADTPGEFFDPEDASVLRFVRDDDGAVVAAEDDSGNRFERVP